MSRIAFIFPGQGAQKCGMGKDFYENTEIGRSVFDRASELLGFSMPELCFEENDRLDITEYTQAAMVTASIAMMEVLKARGVKPDVAAGLSLGEYCALVAAGVMSADDAISTCEKLKAAGAKRALLLNVSGPFHSGMLTEAGRKLGQVLENVAVNEPQIPYVANVNASYVRSAGEVKGLLERQVSSSVRWQQSVEAMIADGVDTFIEIGPGKTLAGFMKKINRGVTTLNIETLEDVDKVVNALQAQ